MTHMPFLIFHGYRVELCTTWQMGENKPLMVRIDNRCHSVWLIQCIDRCVGYLLSYTCNGNWRSCDVVESWRSVEKVSWTEDKKLVVFASGCLFRTSQVQRNWLSVSLKVCNIHKRIKWRTNCVNCSWKRELPKFPVKVQGENMATARTSALY